MKDAAVFYDPKALRERAGKVDVIARKHVGDFRDTMLMQAWALWLAAELVEAAIGACREAADELGFSDQLSAEDRHAIIGMTFEAMREELRRKGKTQ